MPPRPLAVLACARAGWATVRARWKADLPALPGWEPRFYDVERFAPGVRRLVEATGKARTFAYLAAGCAAARAAWRDGCRAMLVSTILDGLFVPELPGVRYFLYGDSTPEQLSRLYDGRPLRFPFDRLMRRLGALARRGHVFLGMSNWYLEALRREYAVPADRAVLLPLYVDGEKWSPAPARPPDPARPLRVLFVGGHFERKGGDLLLELARRRRFPEIAWEIVTSAELPELPGVRCHRGLRPESAELIGLVRSCDLLLLPTRADCNSHVALEAAAAGLPAVITRMGGIPDLVRDGETGTLLPVPTLGAVAAALEPYVRDRGLAPRQGAAARAFVTERFSRARHLEILRTTLDRFAPP